MQASGEGRNALRAASPRSLASSHTLGQTGTSWTPRLRCATPTYAEDRHFEYTATGSRHLGNLRRMRQRGLPLAELPSASRSLSRLPGQVGRNGAREAGRALGLSRIRSLRTPLRVLWHNRQPDHRPRVRRGHGAHKDARYEVSHLACRQRLPCGFPDAVPLVQFEQGARRAVPSAPYCEVRKHALTCTDRTAVLNRRRESWHFPI